MAKIDSYRDLIVWQKAMDVAENCFRFTSSWPREYRFELTKQIHGAAVSIPSNIAEGFNRHAQPAYVNHLRIALGSLAELETQLSLAVRLGLITETSIESTRSLLDEVSRILHALTKSLDKRGGRRDAGGARQCGSREAREEYGTKRE
jgi:four helix bundle protein